jgi:hypothetical protein
MELLLCSSFTPSSLATLSRGFPQTRQAELAAITQADKERPFPLTLFVP